MDGFWFERCTGVSAAHKSKRYRKDSIDTRRLTLSHLDLLDVAISFLSNFDAVSWIY
jgi:hypothetical protein